MAPRELLRRRLYYDPESVCSQRVLLVLRELGVVPGIDFELVLVSIKVGYGAAKAAGDNTLDEGNPNAWTLFESRAIAAHIATTLTGIDPSYDSPSLIPSDLREMGEMRQWLSVEYSNFHPYFWSIHLERNLKARTGKDTANKDAVASAVTALGPCLDVLEERLSVSGSGWLVGDTPGIGPTLADLNFVASLAALDNADMESEIFASRPALTKWKSKLLRRDSWRWVSGLPRETVLLPRLDSAGMRQLKTSASEGSMLCQALLLAIVAVIFAFVFVGAIE